MKFEVYVNGKYKLETEATNAELAYRGVGCWFMPETPITIRNPETHEETTYTRKLDNAGNLLEVIRH